MKNPFTPIDTRTCTHKRSRLYFVIDQNKSFQFTSCPSLTFRIFDPKLVKQIKSKSNQTDGKKDNSNQLCFFWKHCRRLCFRSFGWTMVIWICKMPRHICINCLPTYQDRETHLSLNGTIADHKFAWLLQIRFNLFYSLPSSFQ